MNNWTMSKKIKSWTKKWLNQAKIRRENRKGFLKLIVWKNKKQMVSVSNKKLFRFKMSHKITKFSKKLKRMNKIVLRLNLLLFKRILEMMFNLIQKDNRDFNHL